jgi:regulator of cell morphogenesis and NO signaling
MFPDSVPFNLSSSASEIVTRDYRAARVFRRYGIEYCCGGRFPLEVICASQGIEPEKVLEDLRKETRDIRLPSDPGYQEWTIDFLIDYIINLHHRYIRNSIPCISDQLKEFIEEHEKRMPHVAGFGRMFERLAKEIIPHLKDEEETVFPYIRQLAHAYQSRETYAVLLVRTLRKPVSRMMRNEQEKITYLLNQLREATDYYHPPEKACVNHKVVLARLRELDLDLTQHLYLENEILFPRVVQIVSELLNEVSA